MKFPMISTAAMTKAAMLASAVSLTVSPIAIQAAFAQDQGYGPPPQGQGYDQGQAPDQGNNGPPDQYYDQPPSPPPDDNGSQPPPPPPDYNGTQPPPPPPGYQPPPESAQQQAEDQRYAAYAESWQERNCVQSHGNVAAGAVIGGVFGALLGSAIGGPGHHAGGAIAGAAIGGTTGAAIAANSANETSPGCPPGYVVRGGAPPFYYAGYGGPYFYAAPYWYHPWIWYGDRWVFRPYPYHTWYYRHYVGRGGHWRH